jgi:hypothetical protein
MNSVSTTNDFDRPSGTGALCIGTQALRAWLVQASGLEEAHPRGERPEAAAEVGDPGPEGCLKALIAERSNRIAQWL